MSKPKGTENLMTRLRREEKPNMSNWSESDLKAYMTRRLASEQRARERMQAKAASTLCPWCNCLVEKVSEAGWYFYKHEPNAPKCQGMWTVMEEKP